jgi:hypothetical protein
MDKELQVYYEERFSMMGSDGWKDFMADVDNMMQSLNNLNAIPDEKTLHFKKGELSILMWLKGLKGISEQSYEAMQ